MPPTPKEMPALIASASGPVQVAFRPKASGTMTKAIGFAKNGGVVGGANDLEMSASFNMPKMSIDMSGLKKQMSKITDLFSGMMKGGGGGKKGCGKPKMKKMLCCPPKPCCKKGGYGGGGGAMMVMPGLGDKSAEREVKKYMGEKELAMLLMKAMHSSGKT